MTRTNGDYILTYTGKKFYAIEPEADSFSLKDIFHALSRNNRFTGHGRKRDITVGEHTLRGVLLARKLGFNIEVQKAFLLHDGSEAYLQDIASPFKKLLPDYMKLEEGIQNAIYSKYLGYVPTEQFYKDVKYIDLLMLINEMEQIMQPTEQWDRPDIHFEFIDLSVSFDNDYVKYCLKELAYELGVKD